MTEHRPWKLVAPWYRWGRQEARQGVPPRQTRPVFQKFDDADFVKGFTKDPQRSLVFKEDIDRVFDVELTDAPSLTSAPFGGRFTRLYAPKLDGDGDRLAQDAALVPTGIRKLYLETHKRYYLIVCELHCDAPGFPSATADQVCQAGFVVRRWSFNVPSESKPAVVEALRGIHKIQAELSHLDGTAPVGGLAAKRRARLIEKMQADGTLESKIIELGVDLRKARAELRTMTAGAGIEPKYEGWKPSQFENIGSWEPVEQTPRTIEESTFPLYPLFADPNLPEHSAMGKAIYFGVVPTSGFDTDARGESRFDDETLYEIRTFVRRHKPECPRLDEAPDCEGEVVWSEPTESYRLAGPSDLTGTSQRPVTIRMPNLAELAAQAAAFPRRNFSPVKVVQPQSLNFSVEDGKAGDAGIGGKQICFFSIPLITIVAWFLLKLFLPIVVFLFGLYFLLKFRFCIPPSVAIDGGLKTQLDALPPGIDVDADFDVSLGLSFTAAELNATLTAAVANHSDLDIPAVTSELEGFSNAALHPLGESIEETDRVPDDEPDAAGVDLEGGLEFEPRVEVTSA